MFRSRNNSVEMNAIIQSTINPLILRMQALEDKVDRLSQDHVTRTDIDKLRSELVGSLVPRDSYEPRHASLVERDAQLEGNLREMRRELEEKVKSFEDRLTQGNDSFQHYLQMFEKRIDANRLYFEERMKQQVEAQLSVKDRAWVRGSQVIGFVATMLVILELVLQHTHWN